MRTSLSKKTAYAGAGAGVVLFAVFGLLPGSLIGGAIGTKLAGLILGLPLQPGLISKSIVFFSMLTGVLLSGITIVTATSCTGWLMGKLICSTSSSLFKRSCGLQTEMHVEKG